MPQYPSCATINSSPNKNCYECLNSNAGVRALVRKGFPARGGVAGVEIERWVANMFLKCCLCVAMI